MTSFPVTPRPYDRWPGAAPRVAPPRAVRDLPLLYHRFWVEPPYPQEFVKWTIPLDMALAVGGAAPAPGGAARRLSPPDVDHLPIDTDLIDRNILSDGPPQQDARPDVEPRKM